jgi:hypothetical protein
MSALCYLMAIVVLLAVGTVLWNGLHGHGYRVGIKLPPATTSNGKKERVLVFIVGIGLIILSILVMIESGSSLSNIAIFVIFMTASSLYFRSHKK